MHLQLSLDHEYSIHLEQYPFFFDIKNDDIHMKHEDHLKDWEKIKTGTGRFCSKCSLEKIKIELKQYPNHLLGCSRCQSVFKRLGNNLIHALI